MRRGCGRPAVGAAYGGNACRSDRCLGGVHSSPSAMAARKPSDNSAATTFKRILSSMLASFRSAKMSTFGCDFENHGPNRCLLEAFFCLQCSKRGSAQCDCRNRLRTAVIQVGNNKVLANLFQVRLNLDPGSSWDPAPSSQADCRCPRVGRVCRAGTGLQCRLTVPPCLRPASAVSQAFSRDRTGCFHRVLSNPAQFTCPCGVSGGSPV